MMVMIQRVRVTIHRNKPGAFHHRRANLGLLQQSRPPTPNFLNLRACWRFRKGRSKVNRSGSFEGGSYAVADGCEDWLEMSGEDEDYKFQLDGIGDQNTNHNYRTVLQLAFPRNICSLSQTVINGPLCRWEENVWVFRICIDWA